MKFIKPVVCVCLVLSAVAWAWPVRADVSGWAEVIDGDTIVVAGNRIRLFGIDARSTLKAARFRASSRAAADLRSGG